MPSVSLLVAFTVALFRFESRYRASPVRPLHYNTLDYIFPITTTMAPTTSSPRLSRLSVLCLFIFFITATQASALFVRQAETCGGNAELQQCGGDFPSSFCCPKSSTCMNLNSGSVKSVICCPAGSDCSYIQPTTCDVTQLNATLHPENQMHLSETDGIELPKCGDNCCSLGYTCQGNMCAKDTSPTPSPSSPSTATPSPSPSSTSPASASQTSDCPASAPVETGSSFDGRSFAAGFFPGLVIGALSTLALLWVIKKRRESQSKERYSGDFGHVARQISDPIYDPQLAARTDFMRRGSRSAASSPNSADRIAQGVKESNNTVVHGFTPRIKSMWERTPKLNFGFGLPANPAPPAVRAGNPYNDPYQTPPPKPKRIHSARRTSSRRTSAIPPHVQPQHQQGRSGALRVDSSETIDVLMPTTGSGYPMNHNNDSGFLQPPQAPGMRGANRYTTDSAHTTFTKLMERAGFDEEPMQAVRDWKTPRV